MGKSFFISKNIYLVPVMNVYNHFLKNSKFDPFFKFQNIFQIFLKFDTSFFWFQNKAQDFSFLEDFSFQNLRQNAFIFCFQEIK